MKSLTKVLKTKSADEFECSESESIRVKLQQFVKGSAFLYSTDGSDFYGRIHSIDLEDVTVDYWGLQESETSSVDYTISFISFFAEANLGAVIFV